MCTPLIKRQENSIPNFRSDEHTNMIQDPLILENFTCRIYWNTEELAELGDDNS